MKTLYITYDGINEKLASSQVLPYLKGLAKRGKDVIVLSYVKGRLEPAFVRKIKEEFSIKNIVILRYHKTPPFFSTVWDIANGLTVAIFLASTSKIDIIHARSYVACCIAFMIKKIFRVPYIFDIRGFLGEERLDSQDWDKDCMPYKVLKHMERRLYRNADFVVTLTRKAKEIVEKDFGVNAEHIEVIPTSVDIGKFGAAASGKAKEYDCIYFGSIGTWYMLDHMLEFFKEYLRLHPGAKMLFLTDGGIDKIFKEAKKLDIDKRHIETDFIVYEKIPEVIGSSRFSIFFIKPCYSKQASCPTKLGESLAAGLPVLTNYGIGDVEEIVESNKVGTVIRDFVKDEYRNAIEKMEGLLSDKDISVRCKKTAADYFSLEKAVDKYDFIYNRISGK